MGLGRIIMSVALVAIIVYAIWYFFIKKSKLLSRCRSGKKVLNIEPSKLKQNPNSSNYAYSIWFYVTDWQYRFGEIKDVLIRGDAAVGSVNPRIYLGEYENNITIQVSTFPSSAGAPPQTTTCGVNNFPLQRWVNLIVSLNNRTLDVYLNGKLIRTCVLPAPAQIRAQDPLMITPNGGFAGWTSNLEYFEHALNPQESYNIYASGPKCGGMSFFDRYKLKISYLVNNMEEASVTI